ncbi:MAG: serine hydrolase [Deltaproteobacteria bacterium]|nr:serine hydrolase [Deltaproteobacteria bacterium]
MNQQKEITKNWMRTLMILLTLIAFSAVISGCSANKIKRLWKVMYLFDEDSIVENFRGMPEMFPYHEIHRGENVFEFEEALQDLPETFEHNGKTYNIEELLENTWTTGLIVIKDDKIRFEKYYRGNTRDTLNISWSVGKSFVSALFGIAIEEGYIKGVDVPVSDYAPELKGSGYDGVPLKHILQMSSGVRFDEDYKAFFSDINRMGRVVAMGDSINEFAASLESEREPGTYHHYVSMDTQVLGMVLKNTTGKTPSQYLEEKIWKKIGMHSNAKWLVDEMDMELVFGTLNVTLRDYARFGRLYMNHGNWNGEPGDNPLSNTKMGYGYQWWIPENPKGDFMALGVYGQYIYVNPAKQMVIVKNSAFPQWKIGLETNDVVKAWFQHLAEKL